MPSKRRKVLITAIWTLFAACLGGLAMAPLKNAGLMAGAATLFGLLALGLRYLWLTRPSVYRLPRSMPDQLDAAAAERIVRTIPPDAPQTVPFETEQPALPPQIFERLGVLEAGVSLMARRILTLEGQVREMQSGLAAVHGAVDEARQGTLRAVSGEVGQIAGVVRDLAEAVAAHEAQLLAETRAPEPAAPAAPALPTPMSGPAAIPPHEPSPRLREAILAGRIDLLLQPVMAVPGRRLRYHELLGRASGEGLSVQGDQLTQDAQALGLGARHGRFMLGHGLRVARHLLGQGSETRVICPIAIEALADPVVFRELSTIASAEPELPRRILLKLSQAEWRGAGALEHDVLAGVRDLGFRFVLDGIADLRLDGHSFAIQGVSLVKTPISLLLAAAEGGAATEIHPYDLAGLLARHGVTLVASEVATDRLALELADFGAPLAQGVAFGEPRPLRLDLLEASERQPAVAPAPASVKAAPSTTSVPVKPQLPATAPGPVEAPSRVSLRSLLRRTTA